MQIMDEERSKNTTTIVSTMAYLVFAPCAAVVAGLPGFLFTTGMFGMEFEANMILYVAVTAITAVLLLNAYSNAATGRYFKLWSGDTGRKARAKAAGIQAREGKKGSKDTRYNDIESATQMESKAFALGKNNIIFVPGARFIASNIDINCYLTAAIFLHLFVQVDNQLILSMIAKHCVE